MYSVMALDALGYAPDHPLRMEALRHFDRLMVDDGERFFFQPCFSPVWDTAIAAYALAESGAHHAAVGRAADWLLANEVRRKSDWSVKRPHTEASGWGFFYRNDHYPDIDDTAMVLLALSQAPGSDRAAQQACHRRAIDWLLAMQSRDGGWAAFDADNNWKFLNNVPFADHNAMLDPTCPDITGRALEALAAHGVGHGHRAVRRGVEWLIKNQQDDGSWYGRWGVAYIYGTCFALRGLAASGESDREAHVLRGGEWLRSIQNADGGWGESCASYDHGVFTPGSSTPSQSAWAILGLIAGGDAHSSSVENGMDYLLRTQLPDGVPKSVLLELSPVQRLFPAARAVFVREDPGQFEWIAYEVSNRHDRRLGRIHFQEQDAPPSGVAEECRAGRCVGVQPVPDSAAQDRRQAQAASHDR
jgi:squalene-hopene/tetraprenyl-beta-curcumene cyclase